ncbi:MAG: hypothetical protein FJ164_08365 [Gammaproteobacteria bacterium]|nr:hypothetical protein [Gammaproteobacteria bacterium]
MKKSIIAMIIGAASMGAQAQGFAPWANAVATEAVAGAAGSVGAAERSSVAAAGPFYRPEAPTTDSADSTSAQVKVGPWYLAQ